MFDQDKEWHQKSFPLQILVLSLRLIQTFVRKSSGKGAHRGIRPDVLLFRIQLYNLAIETFVKFPSIRGSHFEGVLHRSQKSCACQNCRRLPGSNNKGSELEKLLLLRQPDLDWQSDPVEVQDTGKNCRASRFAGPCD